MEKIKQFIIDKKGYLLSFFIPLLILIFIFTTFKVFFFKEYNLLISDMLR